VVLCSLPFLSARSSMLCRAPSSRSSLQRTIWERLWSVSEITLRRCPRDRTNGPGSLRRAPIQRRVPTESGLRGSPPDRPRAASTVSVKSVVRSIARHPGYRVNQRLS
jgi:hypothetical protein